MFTPTRSLLSQYQPLVLDLCDESGYTLEYTVPGLVSEYGEVVGKFAKSFWSGETETLDADLALEFGDMLWMIAVLEDLLRPHRLETPYLDRVRYIPPTSPHEALLVLGEKVTRFAREIAYLAGREDGGTYNTPYVYGVRTESEDLYRDLQDLWARTLRAANQTTGLPAETILERNIEKLRSRRDRGVMIGNGDHR